MIRMLGLLFILAKMAPAPISKPRIYKLKTQMSKYYSPRRSKINPIML